MLYFELSNQARTEHQLVWIPRMLGVGGTLQGGLKSASLMCCYLFFIDTCEEVVFQTEVLGALWKGKLFRPQILSAHRWYWNVTWGGGGLSPTEVWLGGAPWWHKPLVRSWLIGMNWRLNNISEQGALGFPGNPVSGLEAARGSCCEALGRSKLVEIVLGEGVSLLPSRCCGTLWWLHSE